MGKDIMTTKHCLSCDTDLPATLEFFYFTQNELQTPCKGCKKIQRKKNKEKRRKYSKKYRKENDQRLKDEAKEFRLKNKDNVSKRNKKYRENNLEKKREKDRQYYHNNKEKRKQYNKNNRENTNKWERNKLQNDIPFKLRKSISSTINQTLKRSGCSKLGESILQYLPYSFDELKSHIESLFEPWMTWVNKGNYRESEWNNDDPTTWKWQLDHIIPQSDLPYTSMEDENFKKCWSLENLRPYSAKLNLIDGVRKTRHRKV